MFIFLNLTLHSFGPENFTPLVHNGNFQKGLIEEIRVIKYIIHSQHAILVGKKTSKTKPHERMHQPNITSFILRWGMYIQKNDIKPPPLSIIHDTVSLTDLYPHNC
jgi:hypothetical protein